MEAIVGLTGMPGSGKTLVAEALESSHAYKVLSLSRLLTEAVEQPENPSSTRAALESVTDSQEDPRTHVSRGTRMGRD